jgi:hypothetical protein
MKRHRNSSATLTCIALLFVLMAGCSGPAASARSPAASLDSTGTSQASETPQAEGAVYESVGFSVPLTVIVESGLTSPPEFDSYNLLTWTSATSGDDKIRFFIPHTLRPPGGNGLVAPPADYATYLLGQASDGATFSDRSDTTIQGRPAILVTATTETMLDESIGCAPMEPAPACFGLDPTLALRMAIIELSDGRTLVAWARTAAASPNKAFFALFERMLSTLQFDTERSPGSTPYAAPSLATGEATPIDGTYTTSFTRAELVASPLLPDEGEINDANWGDLELIFDHGSFSMLQENGVTSSAVSGTYEVTGNELLIVIDAETFGMRWSLEGDTLRLSREADHIGPTPYVLKPWTRS